MSAARSWTSRLKIEPANSIVLIAIATIVIATIAWYGRLSRSPLHAAFVTRYLDIRPEKGKALETDFSDPIYLDGLTALKVRRADAFPVGAEPPDLSRASGRLRLSGSMTLSGLSLGTAKLIRLTGEANSCVKIETRGGGSLTLNLEVERASLAFGDVPQTMDGAVSIETVSAILCLLGASKMNMLGVGSIATTTDPVPSYPVPLDSGIESGMLKLPWSGRNEQLEAGDSLTLGGLDGLASISIKPTQKGVSTLSVVFSGYGRQVATGAPGFEIDRRPRLIEAVRGKDALGGIIAVILSVWSGIWGIVRFKRSNV